MGVSEIMAILAIVHYWHRYRRTVDPCLDERSMGW
jgi:hypothetical protein